MKDIKNYEGLYRIDEKGNVYSLYTNKILKPSICGGGYLGVSLVKNGKKKTKQIHALVAEAYLINENDYPVINHKDGNKLNNNVSNLEWCTYQDNTNHAIENGLMRVNGEEHPMFGKKHKESSKERMRQAKLGKSGSLHPRSKSVKMIDPNTNKIIKVFESQGVASKEMNVSQGNISSVLTGKRNTTGGYRWEYHNG